MKKETKKLLAVLVSVACVIAVIAVILSTVDFKKPSDYYGETGKKKDVVGTVTLEIRCDTITEKSESEFVPKDGTVLKKTQFDIEKGETVFDILVEAAKENKLHIEHSGTTPTSNSFRSISLMK